MVYVKVDGNNVTKALREFTRKVKSAGIIQEVRHRQEYMKPSEKKKWKREEAVRKRIRESRREKKVNRSQDD